MASMPVSHRAGIVLFIAGFALLSVCIQPSLAETLSYSVELSKGDVAVETVDGLSRVVVREQGYDRLPVEGRPALPYRVINVLLPQGQRVESFDFNASTEILIKSGAKVEPTTAMVSEDGVVGSGAKFLEADGEVYPESHGRFLGTGYLHGRGIASFAVFPVRVQGSDVTLTESIEVRITTALGVGEGVVVRERYREGHGEKLDSVLRDLVVNPNMPYSFNEVRVAKKKGGFQPTSYPSLEGSAVDYVIVTTDALASEFQRLADWKTAKGVPTVVRTVEWIEANTRNGVDIQETIRFFLQDAYAKWGITYVLLGGDTDTMPPRYAISRFYQGGTELPADMYFSCLDGSWNDNHDSFWGEAFFLQVLDTPDLYAEVYNGRMPISDPVDISAMIDKIISYDLATNVDYLDRFMFLAEVLFPTDWKQGDPISLNGADFTEFTLATAMVGHPMDLVRMYETEELYPGSVDENRQAAVDSLNSGVNHVNHIGHGYRFNMSVADASIQSVDADGLTNDGEWFNLYMLNCTAAAFDFFCLAEHFMQNNTGGAVSVIGANESAFPNASSNYMNEYYRLLFQEDVVHIGEAFARSRLPRTPVALAGDNVDLWTHYIYTILADPEMSLYSGPVGTMDVFHASNVGLGENAILVNVTSGGQPVDSALVCLSKGDEDYQYEATTALGNVIINFTTESPGSISVVVTARNFGRQQSYITVNPEAGAYVSFSGLAVDDDMSGGSFGNGDGVVDAGETIDFTLDLKNTGQSASDSVWVVLRSSNMSVTILDSIAEVGAIAPGGMATALDPVRVAFDAGIADESAVEFTLEVHDASAGLWNDSFKKVVHAPIIDLITLRIDDDAPLGNGNGIVESGEEFKLYYQIKNYGTGAANGLTAELFDLTAAFTVINGTDSYPDLAPFVASENVAGFHLIEVSTIGENPLRIVITDFLSRTVQDTIELRPPTPPANFVFDSSLGPDRLEVAWDHSASLDVAHYNVYHSLTPGGPYQVVTVDPIDHAVYLDTGLSAITRYYYVVTAIDDSGNESTFSTEFSASTNPPQMPGFPIAMATQTTSSPAVGDIDGDGDLEIVVGNNYVYAWHHDGNEIRDGDFDPQSWGPINEEGEAFTASIALANLDNNPGLDIIAADLITKSVYCMDVNGDLLPGWPRAGENDFRAAPAAGDIDGDGFHEVIAVDSWGVIYAWHRDGTEVIDGDSNPLTDGVFFRTPVTSFHYQSPSLCDLDGDGKEEIILGTRTNSIYALNEDGSSVPGFPFVMAGEMAGSIVTGDIDNDNMPEILAHSKSTEVYLINHDGTLAPNWPRYITMNSPFFTPSPALADFDNDGTLEIVIPYHNSIEGRLYIVNHDASDYPGWPIVYSTTVATESSPTVADVDGNGVLDIVLGDESRFIYAWDINGTMIEGFPIATMDAVRAVPFLTDVDLDGDLDMVVHSWDQNVYLYDLGAVFDANQKSWPTIQANVHRNGKYGYTVPTAIGGASFMFNVRQGAVDLTWLLPSLETYRFNVLRSVVDGDEPRGFVTVVSGMSADEQGMIHLRDQDVEMGVRYIYRLEAADDPDDAFTTESIYVPISRAEMSQNYPNPFNPTTQIVYYVPDGAAQNVSLTIYDVTGARVRTLVSGARNAGRYTAEWNGKDDSGNLVGSGVYFYRLEQPGFSATKKMLLLK